jgi:molybdopterin synthase catalytic subunit
VLLPPAGDDWVVLCAEPLPLGQLATWPVVPGCGAVVLFAGTVRDHADGRPGVTSLDYEAYGEVALKTMWDIAEDLRSRWPATGRMAMLHRTGLLVPTDVSVVVSVSAPHRPEAFDAARFGIDTIKAKVPIWKRETWEGGRAWGLGAHDLNAARGDEPQPQATTELSGSEHMIQLGS